MPIDADATRPVFDVEAAIAEVRAHPERAGVVLGEALGEICYLRGALATAVREERERCVKERCDQCRWGDAVTRDEFGEWWHPKPSGYPAGTSPIECTATNTHERAYKAPTPATREDLPAGSATS